MSNSVKYMVMGSMAVAGLITVGAILDFILGFPFGGHAIMDVCFIIGAGLVLYMGYESLRDLS